MENVFIFCSFLGGTILVVQTVLAAVGFGFGGLDVDIDMGDTDIGGADMGDGMVGHGSSFGVHMFKVISLRTMIAGITFFGLAGWLTLTCTSGGTSIAVWSTKSTTGGMTGTTGGMIGTTGGMIGTTGVLTDGSGSHIEDFPGNIRG